MQSLMSLNYDLKNKFRKQRNRKGNGYMAGINDKST